VGRRYNYLFQAYATDWNNRDLNVNVVNQTLSLTLSPR
jgi:hypothetical protein